MNKLTIEKLKQDNLIVYEYIRGSHLYNLQREDGMSDLDIGGVFISPIDTVLGMDKFYQDQVSDERNDTTYLEIEKWLALLAASNPNALESLFIRKDKIIGDVHPVVQLVIDNRDKFITKQCFDPFIGYAVQQIRRARGLNKKIVNPVYERKTVLDFCHVPHGQGTIPASQWLKERGLKQQYCGLVALSHARDLYGVYYDWGMHKQFLIDNDCSDNSKIELVRTGEKVGVWPEPLNPWFTWDNVIQPPIGYKGIVKTIDGNTNESNSVRLSSVEKGVKPICYMSWNSQGYATHCKDYNEYQIWIKERNPVRYESNLNKNFDGKNLMHSFRLLTMGLEIARGEGFNVERTHDREFLMKVRNHEFEYDELIEKLDGLKLEMETAMANSTLPEKVDEEFVNNLLIEIRKMQIKNEQ